jgi:hypothetical protein
MIITGARKIRCLWLSTTYLGNFDPPPPPHTHRSKHKNIFLPRHLYLGENTSQLTMLTGKR